MMLVMTMLGDDGDDDDEEEEKEADADYVDNND